MNTTPPINVNIIYNNNTDYGIDTSWAQSSPSLCPTAACPLLLHCYNLNQCSSRSTSPDTSSAIFVEKWGSEKMAERRGYIYTNDRTNLVVD